MNKLKKKLRIILKEKEQTNRMPRIHQKTVPNQSREQSCNEKNMD